MAVRKKDVNKGILAVIFLCAAFYFVPLLTIFFIATGFLDIMRNEKKDRALFDRYFFGNGIFCWILSPINLFFDLLCDRNRKIYSLEDLPEGCRKEIDSVIAACAAHKAEIIENVDRSFVSGRRGMYVYRWFGKKYNTEIQEFNRPFKHLQTIAISVFEDNEASSFHFGPLRLTLRVLYNLTPAEDGEIFIECGHVRHHWRNDPLFIFDDTLMHRSVNLSDKRRYCVFMDIMRPSPLPLALSIFMSMFSTIARPLRSVFYRRWEILDTGS